MQSGVEADPAGAGEGRRRRGRELVELVVRVEGGEVQRNVGAEFGGDPLRQRGDFGFGIVEAGSKIPAGCNCLLKTQHCANTKVDVYGVTPTRCRKVN